jgi:hypothetical protein
MAFQSNWFGHPRFAVAATGSGVIKRGERGTPVAILQHALAQLGHPLPKSTKSNGSMDGIFGSETFDSVKGFQKKSLPKETPDGKVGPKTLGELDKRLVNMVPPKIASATWGDAPPGVPGRPKEVSMGPILGSAQAVRQPHDMACWAACLSFWARYCRGGRPYLKPGRIIALYGHLSSSAGPKMGGMPTGGIEQIVGDRATPENVIDPSDNALRWRGFVINPFSVSRLDYDWLKANTGASKALYFGYTIDGCSHINVIGYYDFEGTPLVWAMEPWDGRFKLRDIEFYQQSTRSFVVTPY